MRLENFIKNEVKFGITNYKSSTYSALIRDIQDGKLKNEHSIVDASRVVNLVRNAMYFVEKQNRVANWMYKLFNERVKFFKSDLLYDFKFISQNPEVENFLWLLRETGSDILTKEDDISLYAERNDTFYRIDKYGAEYKIESISLNEIQDGGLLFKASWMIEKNLIKKGGKNE